MAALTFAHDFSSSIALDSSLVGQPDSGIFWNRGVHPLITIDNLMNYLPVVDFYLKQWSATETYGKFSSTRVRTDIVTYQNKIYESIKAGNTNQTPGTAVTYWLETNIESLRLKGFLHSVTDNVKNALHLSTSLIENQLIYSLGKHERTSGDDWIGWAFEPKNSDYVKIRINQIALQAMTDEPVLLYVINQNRLVTTITLNPDNGVLSFEDVNYTISGKGVFYFVMESIEVLSDSDFVDPLKYDGFVAYPVVGNGDDKLTVEYKETNYTNGLGFNVSCYLDSSAYIEANELFLSDFYQSQFELDCMNMFLCNPFIAANRNERVINNEMKGIIATQTLELNLNTVAKKYEAKRKQTMASIQKTFDKMIQRKPRQLIIESDVL